jgi:hypothetical protein
MNHWLFADDTKLVGEASTKEAKGLRRKILEQFCRASGAAIHSRKSSSNLREESPEKNPRYYGHQCS